MTGPRLPKRAEAGVVIGGYELVRRIGRGGMAEVWVARKALGKKGSKFVAIKLIADHYVGDERYARMFRAEAELAAVLSHANIVQVFDEGEEDDRSYLIMEWVDGLNLLKLGAVLSLVDDEQRRFRVTSYIIGQLLYALNYAHSITSYDGSPLGVVHRDVSPQNVLVSNHGEVKLTDFGVAFHNFEESSGIHVKGKVRYMSPEQLRGETRLPTVDLYAVGALLHELLDGKKFRGEVEDGQELFTTVLSGQVAPLSRPTPPELDRLRLRLLEPDPLRRIQTAEEAINVLKRYPGYGDARDELTKLCGSLTGVVRPRVGPGQSSQVPAADQHTTRWGGRQALAKPKVNAVAEARAERRPPPPPPRPPARPLRIPSGVSQASSTTAVKGLAMAHELESEAFITGHTEMVQPQSLVALMAEPLRQQEPARIVSTSAPTVSVRAADMWAPGASPIPTHVANQPSQPIAVPRSAPVELVVSNPSRMPPTERLSSSEASAAAPQPGATEVFDASMMVEVGSGSGTDQEMLPPRLRSDGTDTSRELRPAMPMSNSVSIVLPKRSAMAVIGLGLVMVAVTSVGVTWLLFTRGDGQLATTGGELATSMVAAKEAGPKAEEAVAVPGARVPAADEVDGSAEDVEPRAAAADEQAEAQVEAPTETQAEAEAPTEAQADDEPSPEAETESEAEPRAAAAEADAKPVPTGPAATSGPEASKKEPRKAKVLPPVAVKVRGGLGLDKAQVRIGSHTLGVGNDSEAQVPAGRKRLKWRKTAADPWQSAGSWTFKSGPQVMIFVTKDGLKIRTIG